MKHFRFSQMRFYSHSYRRSHSLLRQRKCPQIADLSTDLLIVPNLLAVVDAVGIINYQTILLIIYQYNKMTGIGKITGTHAADNGMSFLQFPNQALKTAELPV